MNARQQRFVTQLARFLVENQAGKSIRLELERMRPGAIVTLAKEWAELRATTPLLGYPTVEQAETELADFLGL